MTEPVTPHFAARCAFLRMTLDSKRGEGVVNICQHGMREGMECIGPFLDDFETTCRLWELKPGSLPYLLGEYTPTRTHTYARQTRRRWE